MKQSRIGDPSSYIEYQRIDALGRRCYNTLFDEHGDTSSNYPQFLLVLGMQIEPMLRLGGSIVTTGSVVDFFVNSYPGFRLLLSLERAGILTPKTTITTESLSQCQKRFRHGRQNWTQKLESFTSNVYGQDLPMRIFDQIWFWENLSDNKKSGPVLDRNQRDDLIRRMRILLDDRGVRRCRCTSTTCTRRCSPTGSRSSRTRP